MEVEFLDQRLAAVRTANADQTGLPPAVIASCRRKLLLLDSAPDERTLRNWKSLGYQTSSGPPPLDRFIPLDGGWRIVFTLDDNAQPPRIQIRSIAAHH